MPPAPPPAARRGARALLVIVPPLLVGFATGALLASATTPPPRAPAEAALATQSTRETRPHPDEVVTPEHVRRRTPAPRSEARRDADASNASHLSPGSGDAGASAAGPTRRSVQASIDAIDPRAWLASYGTVVETPITEYGTVVETRLAADHSRIDDPIAPSIPVD